MPEHSMPCRQWLEPLSEYISGEAAQVLCDQIEAHLAECKACRIVVDSLKKTIVLYRSTNPQDLPSDIRRRLYHVLDLDDYLVE